MSLYITYIENCEQVAENFKKIKDAEKLIDGTKLKEFTIAASIKTVQDVEDLIQVLTTAKINMMFNIKPVMENIMDTWEKIQMGISRGEIKEGFIEQILASKPNL